MPHNAYDMQEFYATAQGQSALALLLRRFGAWWPEADLKGDYMLGVGYALPYLDECRGPRHVFAVLSMDMGAIAWPARGPGRCIVASKDWPLQANSVDFVLMIHELEFAKDPAKMLEEAWRVLKPEGRLMVVAPNRKGFWASAEHTPFGHGRPFTSKQLHDVLRESNFALERMSGALLAPPVRNVTFTQKISPLIEKLASVLTGRCGVIVAEATKRLYAPIRGTTKLATKPAIAWGAPAPAAGQLRKI